MPGPLLSSPDQATVKLPGLEAGSAATVLVGGVESTMVVAWALGGVACWLPALLIALP